MENKLIAHCGLNCGVCSMYLQRDRGLYKSKTGGCPGCRVRYNGCGLAKCEPLETGRISFCFDCDDYPCEASNRLEKRYSKKYGVSLKANLERIRTEGLEGFLASEAEKWRCDKCGGTVSMHTKQCIDCGQII